jgi:hypothetical protein
MQTHSVVLQDTSQFLTNDFIVEMPEVKSVAVIVQNTLYSNVSLAVSQYCNDLEGSDYNVILYSEAISTVQELKEKLVQWYEQDHLVGAVIIGRLPYARFYHDAVESFPSEQFICDLYLMDMDGTWGERDKPDGIYETHTGDIQPEIFVGRIDPTCLSWGPGPAVQINDYLSRLHSYRTGGLERSHKALVYVDDDWAGYWGTQWGNDVGLAYSNRTYVDNVNITTADDWLNNRLNQDYQWTHICVHSSATTHSFGPEGKGQGTTISTQIRDVPPSFNFYNLFACRGTQWTTPDNLGVTYTFSGPYSIAAVGSTKIGGMMECEYFYSPLSENASLGESLVDWFSHTLSNQSAVGSYFVQWYYGMTIIGDPLLTIIYDCAVPRPVISSSTHPNPSVWSRNPCPEFNWSVPADVNGISGYYYVFDQQPSTVPGPETGTYTQTNGTLIQSELSTGVYYLHVVAKDVVGNVGKTAAHFRVNIDRTPPTTEIVSPVRFCNISTTSTLVTWVTHDDDSGYFDASVWVDNPSNIVYSGTSESTTLSGLADGQHVINVTVHDAAGNEASNQTVIRVDLNNPTVHITSPSNGALTASSFLVTWEAYDAESGYRRAEVRIDDIVKSLVWAPDASVQVSYLDVGTHELIVSVHDWANRTASDSITITVGEAPLGGLLLGGVLGIGCVVVGVIAFYGIRSRWWNARMSK